MRLHDVDECVFHMQIIYTAKLQYRQLNRGFNQQSIETHAQTMNIQILMQIYVRLAVMEVMMRLITANVFTAPTALI